MVQETTGVLLITKERFRQLAEEGWSYRHDDVNGKNSELAYAAATYILLFIEPDGDHHKLWPWAPFNLKPTPDDPIRQLTKAGALIAAEIDRLLRIKAKEPTKSS